MSALDRPLDCCVKPTAFLDNFAASFFFAAAFRTVRIPSNGFFRLVGFAEATIILSSLLPFYTAS
jgi:hypothetical protein